MMKYLTAAVVGTAAYMLYLNCNYDLIQERETGRVKYLFLLKGRRLLFLGALCSVAMPVIWLFSYYGYGPLKTVRYCLLLAALFPIAREDAKTKQIPNRWLLYLLAVRVVVFIAETVCYPSLLTDNLTFTLTGGAVCGGIMFIAYVVSRHAVGMGDVKLFAVLGVFLGVGATYTVMLAASILAALYGICRMAMKKIKLKDEIAFAPFIALGALIVMGMGF